MSFARISRAVRICPRNRSISVEDIIATAWEDTRHTATYACSKELFTRFDPIDPTKIVAGLDHILPFRAGLLKGMYYLGQPLVQWRRHDHNWSDRTSNKTSSPLVQAETNTAYDVAAMIYNLEELVRFSIQADQGRERLTALYQKLVSLTLEQVQF